LSHGRDGPGILGRRVVNVDVAPGGERCGIDRRRQFSLRPKGDRSVDREAQ
jgi:hypothetical protein